MKLGIIFGSALMDELEGSGFSEKSIATEYGTVTVFEKDNHFFVQRHSKGIPPHKINHKANIAALKKIGVKNIIAFNSVGSLKEPISPGTIVVPDDYIDLANSQTFFDDSMTFTVPGISSKLREKIIDLCKHNKIDVMGNGVYFQTRGPRFETAAEIRMITHYADIVGMTMGNEATLSKELEMEYASICSVDNYTNGIVDLKVEDVLDSQIDSREKVRKLLHLIMEGEE